jgi:hypothetical protein
VLASPSSNYKLQTQTLIREGTPHQQILNCLKEFKKEEEGELVAGPRLVPDTKSDWPADHRLKCNFDLEPVSWLSHVRVGGLQS